MKSPELFIILINIAFILPAYFFLYPKFAGSNGNKVAFFDLCITCIILLIAGFIFWGKGVEFNAVVAELNWFWFTIVTYAALEIPLMLWYYKKHNVWDSFTDN